MLPLLGLGERLHPEFDAAFISTPDKSKADIPSHEQVRRAWNVVNAELWKGFEKKSWSDWLARHTAVSEEDFAKDPRAIAAKEGRTPRHIATVRQLRSRASQQESSAPEGQHNWREMCVPGIQHALACLMRCSR